MRRSIGLAVACWWLIVALGALGVGVHSTTLTPGTAAMALLLIVAPATLAVPAGRRLAMPLWALETIACWAALGILVVLVDPLALGRTLALCLALPFAFGVFASPALLFAAWHAPDRAAAARRNGYCWAALPTGLLLLRGLDVFDPLILLIFCVLIVLVVLLRRSAGHHPAESTGAAAELAPTATGAAAPPAPVAAPPFRPVVAIGTRGRLD